MSRIKHTLASIALFVAIFVNNSFGQSATSFARNTFYADAATKGAYYSVNYDRVFSTGKKFNKSYRAGFSVLNNAIAFPLGINYFTGHEASHFEFGLTAVPYIETYKKLFAGNSQADKKMYLIPGAGYRYQKPAGGLFFKVLAGPIIYLDPPSDHFWKMDTKVYAGATGAIGYSF